MKHKLFMMYLKHLSALTEFEALILMAILAEETVADLKDTLQTIRAIKPSAKSTLFHYITGWQAGDYNELLEDLLEDVLIPALGEE